MSAPHEPRGPHRSPLRERGTHVCMVLNDDADYRAFASGYLADGAALGQKTVSFGPAGGALQAELAGLAAIVADPREDFLGGRALEPETMFAMFREQTALAVREGYSGLRVAADMDWLLPAAPTPQEIVGFEVLLDRVVSELGATVVCAYRRGSFDHGTIAGTLCVHPVHLGHDDEPPFQLIAGPRETWRLCGAIDFTAADHLARALQATAATTPWVLDAGDLKFIDGAGMRAVAEVVRAAGVALELRDAPPFLRRHWDLAGYGDVAPGVQLAG